MTKRILVVGPGRVGKDTACEYLAQITGLRNAGTTSKYLTRYVAAKLGLTEEEAYRSRHESDAMRMLWYETGNEVRTRGPTTLIREALRHGDITGGIRDRAEVVAAKEEGIVDVIVWVANDRVKPDPTLMFTSRDCDVVVENHWGLEEFHERIRRFAAFAGLLRKEEESCHKN